MDLVAPPKKLICYATVHEIVIIILSAIKNCLVWWMKLFSVNHEIIYFWTFYLTNELMNLIVFKWRSHVKCESLLHFKPVARLEQFPGGGARDAVLRFLVFRGLQLN